MVKELSELRLGMGSHLLLIFLSDHPFKITFSRVTVANGKKRWKVSLAKMTSAT
jgi:hypothetical protein